MLVMPMMLMMLVMLVMLMMPMMLSECAVIQNDELSYSRFMSVAL